MGGDRYLFRELLLRDHARLRASLGTLSDQFADAFARPAQTRQPAKRAALRDAT